MTDMNEKDRQDAEQNTRASALNTPAEEEFITRDMTMGDIVANFPETIPVILSYGLHCIGCHISPYETLEMGCRGHGMPEAIIEKLVSDTNEVVKLTRAMKNE